MTVSRSASAWAMLGTVSARASLFALAAAGAGRLTRYPQADLVQRHDQGSGAAITIGPAAPTWSAAANWLMWAGFSIPVAVACPGLAGAGAFTLVGYAFWICSESSLSYMERISGDKTALGSPEPAPAALEADSNRLLKSGSEPLVEAEGA